MCCYHLYHNWWSLVLPLMPINRGIVIELSERECREWSEEKKRERGVAAICSSVCELGVELEWMWYSSSIYLFYILSLILIILTSPVDVGNLSNHVKYCVSVLSLQWTTISTSPIEFPNNWYKSIWFKVVFDFFSKMKVVKLVFWPYHRVEEEKTSILVKTAKTSNVGHGCTRRRVI